MGRKALTALRREEILRHFYLLVLEEGLEGASTVKLACRMGSSSSLLMHYFSGKEDLLHSLIEWISAAYESQFLPLLEQQPSPAVRFRFLLDTIFSAEWDNLIDGRILYAVYPLISRYPAIRKHFQENFQIFHRHLERELEAAAEASSALHRLPVWPI
jgi:AcrR family transcriptional regulator